jgi:hypothetical protein
MKYLLAVLTPPLYFASRKKWLAFVVTSFLFVLSIFLIMTVVLIPGALIFWSFSSVVAVWDLRKVMMHEHATIIAEKMAEKMAEANKQPKAA